MELKDFMKMVDKMDIYEKAIAFLGTIEDLEKGYVFIAKNKNGKEYYIRSIGYNHVIISDENDNEIYDMGYISNNEEFIQKLRKAFIEDLGENIHTITIY